MILVMLCLSAPFRGNRCPEAARTPRVAEGIPISASISTALNASTHHDLTIICLLPKGHSNIYLIWLEDCHISLLLTRGQ